MPFFSLFSFIFSAFLCVWHLPSCSDASLANSIDFHLNDISFNNISYVFNASMLCVSICNVYAHTCDFLLSFFSWFFFFSLQLFFKQHTSTFNWRVIVLFIPFPHDVYINRKKFARSWHTHTYLPHSHHISNYIKCVKPITHTKCFGELQFQFFHPSIKKSLEVINTEFIL